MKGFRKIIRRWPENRLNNRFKLIAADTGQKEDTVRKWYDRDSIPCTQWLRLLSSAKKHKVKLTGMELMRIAAGIDLGK